MYEREIWLLFLVGQVEIVSTRSSNHIEEWDGGFENMDEII